MTDNNLPTTINQGEYEAFLAQHKVSQEALNGGGDFLPQLKVNYMDEAKNAAGDTVELKPGLFTITTKDDVTLFAKNVKFRPLLQTYQYIDYDKEADAVVNRSILFNDFSEEAIDEKGTVRCGKPPSKVLKDDAELKKAWSHVNLYRSIDGLVSGTGTDIDGKPVTIENVLCTFRGKGSNFSPFQDEYTKLLPKGSLLWDYDLTLSTTKHKQDPKSAVSYFVVHFEADFGKKLQFSVKEFETVKELAKRVEATNKEISGKYYKALESQQASGQLDAAAHALDITPNDADLDLDLQDSSSD